jgi:hypothetical protein
MLIVSYEFGAQAQEIKRRSPGLATLHLHAIGLHDLANKLRLHVVLVAVKG